MSKKNTQEAAMSRLFGSGPSQRKGEGEEAEEENSAAADPSKRRPEKSEGKTGSAGKGEGLPGKGGGPLEETGYVGEGRYRRASGKERVRITPYVRPDQARALKMAAAAGDDPRGADMSEIIQTLLDQAGYSSSGDLLRAEKSASRQ